MIVCSCLAVIRQDFEQESVWREAAVALARWRYAHEAHPRSHGACKARSRCPRVIRSIQRTSLHRHHPGRCSPRAHAGRLTPSQKSSHGSLWSKGASLRRYDRRPTRALGQCLPIACLHHGRLSPGHESFPYQRLLGRRVSINTGFRAGDIGHVCSLLLELVVSLESPTLSNQL